MANTRYEIHRERTDAAVDAWALIFDASTRAWTVEHLWRRCDPRSGNALLVGKERQSIEIFEADRTGIRLSEHLHAALRRVANEA